MKLPTQTHGPVTLSQIDYAANLSQETFAFTAQIAITVAGTVLTSMVENDGHGGPNGIHSRAVEAAVAAYAATLPAEKIFANCEPVAVSADGLVSTMVGDALQARLQAREHAKWAKKGYTHFAEAVHPKRGAVAFYSKCEPDAAACVRLGVDPATLTVRAL
jgi:hypothetical protein